MRAEGVLNGLAALAHLLRVLVQPALDRLDDIPSGAVKPAPDQPLPFIANVSMKWGWASNQRVDKGGPVRSRSDFR